jgi:hypothetical protein
MHLTAEGALCEVIAPRLGFISGENDTDIPVDKSLLDNRFRFL